MPGERKSTPVSYRRAMCHERGCGRVPNMNIKISTSRILQVVLIVLHILNIALPVVPPAAKIYITTAIGIGNVIVNEWAHASNPDGTPAPVNTPKQ